MVKNDKWLRANASQLGINPTKINPSSVDLCLGEHIIQWSFSDKSKEMLEDYLPNYRLGEGWYKKELNLEVGQDFLFLPKLFYLCHSIEYVQIPNDKAAMLFLKSSAGRVGLEHSHAGWVDPGFKGQLTWEISSHIPVECKIGQPVCQLVYMDSEEPDKDYGVTGRYSGQTGATEARGEFY